MPNTPHHPGRRWRRLIWDSPFTIQQVARRMRVSTTHLSRIINEHSLPSAEVTARFARVIDRPAEKLWAEVTAYQLATATIVQERDCGSD